MTDCEPGRPPCSCVASHGVMLTNTCPLHNPVDALAIEHPVQITGLLDVLDGGVYAGQEWPGGGVFTTGDRGIPPYDLPAAPRWRPSADDEDVLLLTPAEMMAAIRSELLAGPGEDDDPGD